MSDFWQRRLQPTTTAPPQQAPPPQPSGGPWWMPGAAPRTVTQPQQVPVQQPGTVQPGSTPAGPSTGEVPIELLLQQDQYTTEKAQSARDAERCPDCDSVNYMAPKGHPNAMKQCFECGFNPRFAHSTAGASGIGQKNVEAPRAARVQVNSPPAGFPAMGSLINPGQTITG